MNLSKFYIKLGQILLLASFTFLLGISKLFAQPSGFNDQQFVGDFEQAVGLTFDANGRMYVWEKEGKVWVVENGVKLSTPLIDISEEVGGWRDFGLLGVALDPNYLSNGYIYLLYIVDRHHLMNYGTNNYNSNTNEYFEATIGRITRYQATAASGFKVVDYNTRHVLLGETASDGFPNLHQSHGTGHLVFGTDGTLLASFGDGASYSSTDQGSASETYYQQALADGIISSSENIGAYRVQLLSNYAGKIIRFDPQTGAGLPSNPFYQSSNPNSKQSKVWALGLRNPCRFSLRPGTGEHQPEDGDPGVFYIGDVGWGTSEELNVLDQSGLNFGWPKHEGMTYQPGYNNSNYAPSSHELAKLDWRGGTARGTINGTIYNVGSSQIPGPNFTGNASIGGTWYTGTDFPTAYQNTYFHADYGGDWIMNYVFDENNNPVEVRNFKSGADGIVFVGTSPVNGGLYYISGAEGNSNQAINAVRKISFSGNNNLSPFANISANVNYGSNPLTVEFNGSQSYDPDNDPITFNWDFGNGNSANSMNPTHTFTSGSGVPTSFNVTLQVSDNNGLSDNESMVISLNNTPPNIVSTSLDGINTFSHTSQTVLDLNAVVNDAEHSNNSLTYHWITELHHNNHFHQEAPDNDPSTTTVITPVGCDGSTYFYRIILTVTDPEGLHAVFHKDIYPDCIGTNQIISFAPIPDKLVDDPNFNLNGTASSGLPVIFHIIQGPATISGTTVSLNGTPGEVLVRAIQSGNGTYAPAKVVEHIFQVTFPVVFPCDNETSVSGNIISVTSNNGVANTNQITGAPNANAAQFYDHQDRLTAELDDIVPAGEQITITWKARNYSSSYPGPARLSVAESTDGINYTFNTTLSTSEKVNYINQNITVASDTRFLELKNASTSSNSSPDLDVDAASYAIVICNDICLEGPEPGTPCDDGNPNTVNDVILSNCDCEGTTNYDCPTIQANIGDSCDDGNPNTENDIINANCECAGGIIYDCPSIQANIGDSCDDGDSNTENDIVNATCDCEGTPIGGSTTVCASVIASKDDAEEAPTGSVSLGSGDLELVFDNGVNGNQVVGMRFLNLNIPQGANISEAYIQFTTDATIGIDPCILNIYGQASDNAATFANTAGNISTRPKTTATVSWSPPAWNTSGEAGPAQKTINIAPLIQEIVNRSGYTSSSSIAIIIDGTGKRTATSFNGGPNDAPQLCVTYGSGSGCPDDDNDGVCNDDDICPGGPEPGTPCDDGDPNTANDLVNANCICEGTPTGGSTTVCASVIASKDDAEEGPTGSVKLTSSDLELVFDNGINGDQVIGMRFLNLNIPQGADISEAYIQFTTDATVGIDPCILNIYGQASDNAATFANTNGNISTRPKTIATVSWSPPAWNNTGETGAAQKTINIAPLIQEIVNRSGYSSSSSIAIIIDGTGKRSAISFNGDPNGAPELCVTYGGGSGCPDDDNDGVCNDDDICPGYDDNLDADNDGIPDGCDDDCPNEITVSGNITAVVSNNGVSSANQVIGTPNGNPGQFYDHEDKLKAELDDIVIAGEQITITWKARNYTSSYPGPARLSVAESTDGINYTFNTILTTSEKVNYVSQSITVASDTRFLELKNASTSGTPSPDLDVDAAGYSFVICDDICLNGPEPGTPCNDGDPNTQNDVILANCECEGIITFDCPSIQANIGDSCDDGDSNTANDVINSNCECEGTLIGGSTTVCASIITSKDDAEEAPSGSVNVTSGDLELVFDNGLNGNQVVGMRFVNLNIPQGANISEAYIQFTTDATIGINPCILNIYGQASDDAVTFANTSGNISTRPKTTATVSWSPTAWNTTGEAGPAQQTINIASLIQEIVNRSGYTSSSSMVIIIDGTGKRTATSFNGGPNDAPQLCVTYGSGSGCPDDDNDGVCNDDDICPGVPEPGTPCDDGNPATFNDEIDANCECIGDSNPGLVTTSVRISSSSDDAEEKPLLNVNTHSSDLELVRDNDNIDQTIGLRFLGHNIPKAAQIASAYIQFTVDDTGAIDPCELEIYGQASDNPATFSSTPGNITSRPRTASSITWSPAEWVSIGDAGAAQKTVNISAVIQEIVDRGGYTPASAIAIIIDGAGKRSAMSYDLSPNSAPQLIVTFNTNPGCPDSDGDGTCDDDDLCPGGPEPGTPCGGSGPGNLTLIDADFETGIEGFSSQNSGGDNWKRGTEVDASSQYWTVPDNGSDYLFYANDDDCNCNMSNVKLISPAMDFSSITNATLTFDVLFEGNTYQGITETASVEISVDNGPFNLLADIDGINSNWRTESIDLSSFAGLSNIRIAFRYNDGGGWLYGAAIDNVLIEGETSSVEYEIDANCECNPVSNGSGFLSTSGGPESQGVSANYNSEENYRELELGLDPIHVFPNPTVNHLNVSFTGFRADQAVVQIMDRTGKIRFQDKRAIKEGQNVLLIKDLNLEEGLFFIQLYYNSMYRSAKFTVMDTK